MSSWLTAITLVLLMNTWTLIGGIFLNYSVTKKSFSQPRNFLHAVFWMTAWPLLIPKLLGQIVHKVPLPR